jgi:hypothetical protein
MLMKNRDDDREVLPTHEICGVWKMVEQRTSYTVSDFRKLIRKGTDPFDRSSQFLREPKPASLIVAGVPRFGSLDVHLGNMPDDNADHSFPGVPFRRSARTSSHGRLAFGLA